MPYVVPPGRRVLRLRTHCPGCTKTHFIVDLVLDAAARPPLSLTLTGDGETIAKNPYRDHLRCFEDEVAHERPPTTCTLLVALGWDKLRDPREDRAFDLVLENDGPELRATILFDLRSVPRD
jgi:hypothetical protein